MGKVRAIHRLRVVVAAPDRRFLRMAEFLLARQGFEVFTTSRPGALVSTVENHRPDVLILDGTSSLSEAARTAALVEILFKTTTVVIVSEDDRIPAVTNLQVHPKWTAFDDLVASLESMHLGLPAAQAEHP
jgi:DNA-binding NarL/FixJ family response regulator